MEKESPTNDSVDGSAQPQVAGAVDVAEVVMEPAMENGDLVRISERGFRDVKKLRDRGDALGRIVNVHETDQDGLISYDVEWLVVGGTSSKVASHYLYGTTAVAEGLTATRRREKRKPRIFAEDAMQMDTQKAERRAQIKAQKSTKKSTAADTAKKPEPKKQSSKKSSAKETKNTATKESKKAKDQKTPAVTKKKPPAKKPATAAPKRKNAEPAPSAGKKRKTSSTPDPEPQPAESDVAPKGMDLYEKQRREFDRIMARLEKIDPFGWFWDPVPPEFEENYDATKDESKTDDNEGPEPPSYPDHAPYNWEMIRRRKANGRYELDRASREEKEYLELMRPFYKSVKRRRKKSKQNPRVLYPIGVHWELFREDVTAMMNAAYERAADPQAGGRTSVESAVKKLREALDQAVERTGKRQEREMRYYDDRHRFDSVLKQQTNTEAAMQSWRKTPFPERRYERLRKDVVSAGLSELDERTASYELRTNLPDSFIGLSYRYDDTGQSEAWMQSVVEEAGAEASKGADKAKQAAKALAADEGVVRAQVVATMQSLLIGVQDRVMTEMSVLHQRELVSANWIESEELMQEDPMDQDDKSEHERLTPEIVEQPVWGIDCYTRRNILICLDAEFDPKTSLTFVEKWLLPAINACPPDIAHDISNAARILEGLPFQMPSEEERIEKLMEDEDESTSVQQWSHTVLGNALVEKIKTQSPPWLKAAANFIRRARESLGPNFFRVHPKGHGSVLLSQQVEPNRLVTFYRGEIYPAWRWGEKMDAIEITQQRKGLRPTLPDFYNMALERPQTDPRGYGLLFVDASRKGGHGSSLSHSCQPTCEVRVAAMNGELCLAMTTLRELEMGEELTFDYNAATDSLNEYQTALCLCGYGKCRGSFLHFATADCYQKVMNRNCPIASRFSNLIKGCMKRVMSEDDKDVLDNHGFRTASFGAISVNRRDAQSVNQNLSDTMDIVPVWLKTYAADTLRYIEYERRALPITLICDQMPLDTEDEGDEPTTTKKSTKEPTKPESSFFYFSRRQAKRIGDLLQKKGFAKIGLELQNAKQKVAAAYWNNLSEEKKEYWKQEAVRDFERRKKEWEAEQALARKKASAKKTQKPTAAGPKGGMAFQDADAEGVSAMEHRIQHLTQALSRVGRVLDRHREGKLQQESSTDIEDSSLRDVVHSPLKVLSDAEVVKRLWIDGDSVVMALANFIESGTCVSQGLRDDFSEVLKRSGPALVAVGEQDSARRREILKRALLELRSVILNNLQKMLKLFRKYKAQLSSEKDSRSATPNPSPNQDVDEQSLSRADVCDGPSPETPKEDDETAQVSSIEQQEMVGKSPEQNAPESPPGRSCEDPDRESEGGEAERNKYGAAVDDKDETNVENVPSRNSSIEQNVPSSSKTSADKDPGVLNGRSGSETIGMTQDLKGAVSVDDSCVRTSTKVSAREAESVPESSEVLKESHPKQCTGKFSESGLSSSEILLANPWIDHYGDRVALETAADVLLLYANTSNFFAINPYATLQSTPVEVYARELGNAVPKTAIDPELLSPSDAALLKSKSSPVKSKSTENGQPICSPDDVVAKVTVQYGGEYVLSQLLQWYNGGIGQKQGLPDFSGCVTLPHISGCWSSSALPKKKIRSDRKTAYDLKIRQQLVEWLQDPYRRGDPLPDEVKQTFYGNESEKHPVDRVLFGSPVLDFLVMGDETNIFEVLDELDAENKVGNRNALNDALSTVDRGRPAQAVCRWVQCENPGCLKWRKIPWHVDIDLLPEKFFCKDNKWNPERTSCDIPEDDWDGDDKLVGADGKVEGSPIRKKGPASPSRETDFRVGAKFDVRRTVKGKEKYTVGTVTHIDFLGLAKRVKFHYRKTSPDADEWVEFGSDRIAALHSMTGAPVRKKDKVVMSGDNARKGDKPDGASERAIKKNKTVHSSKSAILNKKKTKKSKGASLPGLAVPTHSTGNPEDAQMDCVKDPSSKTGNKKKLKGIVKDVTRSVDQRIAKKNSGPEIEPEMLPASQDDILPGKIPKKRKKVAHISEQDSLLPSVEESEGNIPRKKKKPDPHPEAASAAEAELLSAHKSDTGQDERGLDLKTEAMSVRAPEAPISTDNFTPDSQVATPGPRQVTAEKASPTSAQANALRESSASSTPVLTSSALSGQDHGSDMSIARSDVMGLPSGDTHQTRTNVAAPSSFQPSLSGNQGVASPHPVSSSDRFRGSQRAAGDNFENQNVSQQQAITQQTLQDTTSGDMARQFLPHIAPPAPSTAPAADNHLDLLAALALRSVPNPYDQSPPPDLQSLIQNARTNPALLLQLQQLLQNQQLYRN